MKHRNAIPQQRAPLRANALAIAISAAVSQMALAQTTPENAPVPDAASLGAVTVTATRVVRSGFTAPTPTTVIGSGQIEDRGQTNLTEILNELPTIRQTINNTTAGPSVDRGARSTPDLRGLGPVRTLVLFDGQRSVPSTTTGLTDLNLIPTMLVDRIDVVTGGVSAGWGSDAVAGVVNVVLKRRLTGLHTDLVVGQSTYGDSKQLRAAVAGGKEFADGRGHIVAGLDYDDNKGVGDQFTRPWGRENWGIFSNATSTNGLPQRVLAPYVYVGNATTGGLITGVSGGASPSLRGTAFGAGGTPFQFPFGALTSATQTVGTTAIPGAFAAPMNLNLQIPTQRLNAMARASYDITDDISAWASLLAAANNSTSFTFPNQTAGATAITINADNPFLPASIRSQMPAGSSITLGRYNQDNFGPPQTTADNLTYNLAGGFSGNLPKGWTWDLNAEYGRNTLRQSSANFIVNSRFRAAVDAVVGPNGSIVCRSTLTAPTNGCVPFNVFGNGSPSAAAEAYVRDTQSLRQMTDQLASSLVVRGEPFATWAGKVSLATGVEYRKLKADVDVDDISLGNGFVPNNPKPLHGSYTVREFFAESVVPLASKAPYAKSLDLDVAMRHTDYSTSGSVNTWKSGLVYAPNEQFKVRVTKSLDIRAPNLNELYAFAQQGTANTLVNPWLNGANAGFVTVLTSGNPALKPEKSNNLTYGAVFEPAWAKGLSLSADYFHIKLDGAIASYQNQAIVNQCYAGNAAMCALVVRTPSNQIVQINQRVINLTSYETAGIDLQAGYRTRMQDWFADAKGTLNLSLAATRTTKAILDDGVNGPIDRNGDLNIANPFGRPKWLGTFSANYRNAGLSVGGVVRYVGSGRYDNLYAEGVNGVPQPGGFTINTNRIPAVTYLNLNASYEILNRGDKGKVQLYAIVNNVFNKAPPADPAGAGSTNPVFYDVVGRAFKVGMRADF